MTADLPDVNVLIALAWPNHIHHVAARRWFTSRKDRAWATSPVTEAGFVRVSANPATPHAVTVADALGVLRSWRERADHRFWEDDVSLAGSAEVPRDRIAGHGQVTDAHLLALARRRDGRLSTFDRGVLELARGHEGARHAAHRLSGAGGKADSIRDFRRHRLDAVCQRLHPRKLPAVPIRTLGSGGQRWWRDHSAWRRA